jgi:hypothetical protein
MDTLNLLEHPNNPQEDAQFYLLQRCFTDPAGECTGPVDVINPDILRATLEAPELMYEIRRITSLLKSSDCFEWIHNEAVRNYIIECAEM